MNICKLAKTKEHIERNRHGLCLSAKRSSLSLSKKVNIARSSVIQSVRQQFCNDSFRSLSPSLGMNNNSNRVNNDKQSPTAALAKALFHNKIFKTARYSISKHNESINGNNSAFRTNHKNMQSAQKNSNTIDVLRHSSNDFTSKTNRKIKPKVNMDYFKSQHYKNLVKENNRLEYNKKLLRGKFSYLLNHSNVLCFDMYKKNDALFHKENLVKYVKPKHESSTGIHKDDSLIHVLATPDSFAEKRVYHQYEDNYISPDSFLKNNFTNEEIDTIVSSPMLFKLKEGPFLGTKMKLDFTLRDKLNNEEEKEEEVLLGKKEKVMKKESWLFKTKDYLEYLERSKVKKARNKTKYKEQNRSCCVLKTNCHKKMIEEYRVKRNKKVEDMNKTMRENSSIGLIVSDFYEKQYEEAEDRKLFYLARKAKKIQNKEIITRNRMKSNSHRNSSDDCINIKRLQYNLVQNYQYLAKHQSI